MKLYHCIIKHVFCIHIDPTHLADGTYELVPVHENEPVDAQVNLTKINQDLDQSSEEPKANSA